MVKHTQTIRRQEPTNCLSVFDILWGWRLKGLEVLTLRNIPTSFLASLLNSHLHFFLTTHLQGFPLKGTPCPILTLKNNKFVF